MIEAGLPEARAAVKERPIIFSAPMIRAILAGTKSQTRRLITRANSYRDGYRASAKQWDALDWSSDKIFVDGGPSPAGNPGPYLHVPDADGDCSHRIYPQWQPSDQIWVRETWADVNTADGPGFAYRADGGFMQPEFDGEDFGAGPSYNYEKYPGNYSMWMYDLLAGAPDHGWRSPIHMPRWASRITLELTSVRVERLQEISEADCYAEGIGGASGGTQTAEFGGAQRHFRQLWDSLNDKLAPWASNPWVWVLEFGR